MLGEKLGLSVTAVATAKTALELLTDNHRFSLILMDWQLPDMTGLECTAAIREREARTSRHVPIVAVTANALLGDKQRCLESGMDDYLSKPFTMVQFEATVMRVLASHGETVPA
jgi:CheY-like chemotaxis protein